MYKIIKAYCENDDTTGLFLMDMPTGFGKTYSVLRYIFEACQQEENKDQLYFFITPLKKNLPIKELEERFQKASKIQEFHEKFLFIDSNSECVIQNYSDKLKKEIPSEITETEIFRRFEEEVKFLQKQRKTADHALQSLLKNTESNFCDHTEPAFRQMIQKRLKKYPDVNHRISAIKNDNKWKWLGKLYPAVFTQERQIFFMSMDKFILKNSPIVEPSYYFCDSSIIDRAIIFIDEFDSTKEKILDFIIKNGLQGKIDTVRLFKAIYSALKTNDFPRDLVISSQTGKSSKVLKDMLKDMQKKAERLHTTYSLCFPHHTALDAESNDKNFLFQDYQFHSVLNGDRRYITSVFDHKAKQNIIHFTKEKPESEKYNIHSMFGELRGFIQYFQGMVSKLANNYRKVQNKQHQNEKDELTLEEAVRSILDLFQISAEDAKYLTDQIMTNKFNIDQDKKIKFDESVYEKGFRYYCFENSALHNMRTRMMMCSFRNSPEKILLHVCERAKVIGISATATIPTVIGNYDLEYIQAQLQGRYYILPDEEHERLLQEFEQSQTGYQSEIQIHTELLGATDYSIQTWIDILQNSELGGEVYNTLEVKVHREKSTSHYYHERYARIAMAFKQFLIHDDIQSMLCFLTKKPSRDNNDSKLNFKQLIEVLNLVAESLHSDFNVKKSIICLTSDNYERKKEEIIARLAENEKIFVISTYQTIGAGQNLQYPIPETLRGNLICSNSYPPRDEKDFDAIYLDKPTNLLVNIEPNCKEEEFVKYLFQVEFLQENAEISMKDALEYIRSAFHCYVTGEKGRKIGDIYHKGSIMRYVARIIIQAIGRICRTNQKRQNIYIFADDNIADCLDLSVTDKRILNHEFITLVDKIKDIQKKTQLMETFKDKAELASTRASMKIDHMLNHEWTKTTMKTWAALRQFVMQHPTASEKEALVNPVYRNYVKLPEKNNVLYYTQDEDFHEISIFFTQTQNTQILNAENTRLPRLMKWHVLCEYFISQGYATDFQPNDYILSPPLWNNIYKGALGEIVGSFWFQQILGIHLEELTNSDEFELFDFKIEEKKIYIDFKNWSEVTNKSFDEEMDKIKGKAKQCGCHYVIIANMLTRQNYTIQKFTDDEVVFLIVPSLLNDTETGTITVNQEAVKKIKEICQ
ncbi:MAG: hypothetical protein K2O42_09720 [Oscillospiraceae bacterium]|nr:hypothetical protein [Oscillospiraceae bacterium]